MTAILTGDIHLNDKPQDEYRWGLIDWLLQQTAAEDLFVCGDLTELKDRHSAQFVNRVYRAFMRLQDKFRVVIVKGNHDYLDPKHPFFEFLGNQSDIVYVKEPAVIQTSLGKATFIPAGENWRFKLHKLPYCFTHATFNGAKAENGQTLTGVDPHVLDDYDGYVYSGDVHVPQRLLKGKITYIGEPYHTRFGLNEHKPRLIRLDANGDEENLYFPAPYKSTYTVSRPEDLEEEDAREGDHVKVKLRLRRAEYTKLREFKADIRQIAKDKGWQLYGIEPVPIEIMPAKDDSTEQQAFVQPLELMLRYAKDRRASEHYIRVGKELLDV